MATKMWETIDQIREANRKIGHYFFSRDTLRFFRSRILPTIYDGKFFITSEREPDQPRKYSVRAANSRGDVTTIESGLPSLKSARRWVKP